MKHELIKLPYAYNSLEPYIDEATMKLHHDKHHQTYVDKLNAALEPFAGLQKLKVDELLKGLDKVPEAGRTAVKNHGGGVYNHNFFWATLKKDVKVAKEIGAAIDKEFGSFDAFKKAFIDSALKLFGSGWTWLVLSNGKIEIINLPNQDSPISVGKIPLITLDVWEHSYYKKYENRRAEYAEAFFHVINWDAVNKLYKDGLKGKSFA
jgi:Fe-Mn family superoxide dismutase